MKDDHNLDVVTTPPAQGSLSPDLRRGSLPREIANSDTGRTGVHLGRAKSWARFPTGAIGGTVWAQAASFTVSSGRFFPAGIIVARKCSASSTQSGSVNRLSIR